PNFFRRYHAEINEQRFEQVFAGQQRIRDVRGKGFSIERLQHGAAQRGFAGADLAGENADAFTPSDTGSEGIEGDAVPQAGEKETRVGGETERLFSQPEIWLVG